VFADWSQVTLSGRARGAQLEAGDSVCNGRGARNGRKEGDCCDYETDKYYSKSQAPHEVESTGRRHGGLSSRGTGLGSRFLHDFGRRLSLPVNTQARFVLETVQNPHRHRVFQNGNLLCLVVEVDLCFPGFVSCV
jgi:hypothetical protein